MERTAAAFSLRWKILAWFFVNLAVLGGALFLFLRVQFHVGINSLLAGPTSDRLEAIARPLAAELRQQPEAQWAAALDRAVAAWRQRGLEAVLYRANGRYVAGDVLGLPPGVVQALAQHGHHGPGGPPGGGRPPGEDHGGPPDDFLSMMTSSGDAPDQRGGPPGANDPGPYGPGDQLSRVANEISAAPWEKFMLATDGPRRLLGGRLVGRDAARAGGEAAVFGHAAARVRLAARRGIIL